MTTGPALAIDEDDFQYQKNKTPARTRSARRVV
jgi:hypothetical protein